MRSRELGYIVNKTITCTLFWGSFFLFLFLFLFQGSEGMAPIGPMPLKQCSAGGREVYDYVLRRGIFQPSPLRFVEWNKEYVHGKGKKRVGKR